MSLTLTILRPFSEENKAIEWVHLECPGGSFVVGPGHRPLVNLLSGGGVVLYKEHGQEQSIDVPDEGGLVHVVDGRVVLFLN